jgi:pimeloyl-ACP methyl ester carboxylesterase
LAFDLSDLSCLVASLHCFIANSVLSGSRLHIVGHALGASLALLYAEKWPEVVAQLTVIAPGIART